MPITQAMGSSIEQPLTTPTWPGGDIPQVSRKRKRNSSELTRAVRACDRCKKRKIRCDGTQPCEVCNTAAANCTFDATYTRGRLPVIPRSGLEAHGNSTIAGSLASSVPGASHNYECSRSSALLVDTRTNGTGSNIGPTTISSQSSPEPSWDDTQGQYIGPTSGVDFLLRVQKRLHQSMSESQTSNIFTFGDAPLQTPDLIPSFCMMLPRDAAQRLLDRYFDFAMPTYRFLHRPQVQHLLNEFYDTLGAMRDADSAPANTALLFMVFAQGRVYMPEQELIGPLDLSTRYFLAAEHQLTKERGPVRLTSAQARLTQCYYLLTQSRINHCWSLFGTVSHLILALGLNRSTRLTKTNDHSRIINVECRRRTFWCAYTLDAFLSVALGRPRSFHDDDINAELPTCLDDDELTKSAIEKSPTLPPRMFATLAHIKLARIIGRIVRQLYSIQPISADRRNVLTERISKDLSDWRVEFSRFLESNFNAPSVPAIYVRQQNVLNLTYWHAIILAHRPIVLSNFTRFLHRNNHMHKEAKNDEEGEESIQQFVSAALSTVKTVDEMVRNAQMFRAFWITTYFAFTATIILYVSLLHKRASPHNVYSTCFSAAARCQSHLSMIAEKGSLSERYCLVLEELRVEVLRQTQGTCQPASDSGKQDQNQQQGDTQATSFPSLRNSNSAASFAAMSVEAPIDLNGMPSSAFADSSGWGQFASMVSSGMGNLDEFFADTMEMNV
ncbi:transcriptional regulatory protein GAL4 [Astrocystis sublimbata]|nr:transcriptional regulatory protein GAL4 [Astrocystis sublimbata]